MVVLLWILDGLVAGWLTGKLLAGEGRDLVMDIVMGSAGGIGGGFIVAALNSLVHGKMIYTNMGAIFGAVILTALSRYFSGRREYGSTN
jgi:uncharacterized membrane protein YeaQ/YmgE (transglycosylase-associated protein family)